MHPEHCCAFILNQKKKKRGVGRGDRGKSWGRREDISGAQYAIVPFIMLSDILFVMLIDRDRPKSAT